MPVSEAAQWLGLSHLAVRKRCQRGTLTCQKRGEAWYVLVDGTVLAQGPATDQEGTTGQAGMGRDVPAPDRADRPGRTSPLAEAVAATAATWQVQLERERARASTAEQAAAMWQERARNLEGEIGRLQELLALPVHEDPSNPEPPTKPRFSAWWRRRLGLAS